MDSGHSSSMQSSGGGDDQEFNSHASDSVSGFLNPSFSHFVPTSNPQSSFLSPRHHLPTFLDNPTSNHILQSSFSQSQSQENLNKNSLLSLDSVQYSRGQTSHQPNMSQIQGSSSASMQAQETGVSTVQLGDAAKASGSSDHQTRVVRNTKKRTRASRRAPTTVMTTDTTNFRAMVQEFTGIPEPPFSGSSRRLDLFGFGSAAAPTFRSANHLEPMGTLLPARSISHNVQPIVNPIGNFPNSASTHPFDLYDQHSSMPKHAQDMLSMQNQSQPLLQSSVLNSLNVASFGTTKSQLGSADTFINQEFGLSHGHVTAGFSGMQSHADESYNGHQDHQLRSFNGNYAAQAQCNNSCNLSYNASSSDGKKLDNVSSGAERTAESWIFR